MYRIILIALFFVTFYANANSPLQLDKRLSIVPTTNKTLSSEERMTRLQANIDQLLASQQSAQALVRNFNSHKQNLLSQINEAQSPLPWSKKQDLNQQASMAYLRLSELKEFETSLSDKVTNLINHHNQLPDEIVKARKLSQQHQKTLKAATQSPEGKVLQLQDKLYQQKVLTLESQLASSQKEIDLNQLQLNLVRAQLSQQEQLIETLNQAINLQRQEITNAVIAQSLINSDGSSDAFSLSISEQNKVYREKIQKLSTQISNTVKLQEQAEATYQTQAKKLATIQQQIGWIKLNSAFGEHFLQMLQTLPKPPNKKALQNQIADARLAKYQIEQARTINAQNLALHPSSNTAQHKLLVSQQELEKQLLQSYDQYLGELADLRVSYEQITQQYLHLKSTLNDHLFWVPNASSISKQWFNDLHQSMAWLTAISPIQQIKQSYDQLSTYWSWWIILLILSLMANDLVTPKFRSAMRRDLTFVGNVTQDKFIYTHYALTNSFLFSLIKPLPVILGGFIFYVADQNLVSAVGAGLIAMGCTYLFYRIIYLLSLDKGLLISHFKISQAMVRAAQLRFRLFTIKALPLVGLMAFTEILDNSLVRNSIGRGAFIIFCLTLCWLYKDMLQISYKENRLTQGNKNKRLIHKILWGALILAPLACAGLAIEGYYYTAFQMFLQLQISLVLGLSFLLLYQLIKRWMLIERRRIAFERAKAKRAEQLAQREKDDDTETELATYEEPQVDLETISSQSLGLVRSLLLLGFLVSLVGLWTQTHTALFSLLDGVTLWTSSTSINGIEQLLPITLKSFFFSVIIVGFSLMIATNLPGLLELMILQRLDLSLGTGFALTTVSRYLVIFIGVLAGFSTLGMDWSKMQWLIAALSVGLGFGLQEIFANFISGLIILFEKPVRIGDTVTIRDLTGTVSKIQIRATTIIDWDRKEIIVPNKAFITEQLINWSLSDPITRVIIYISVARGSDPARVEASLYRAVQECDDALSTPEPEVWFAGFGTHTQDYEVRAYAKDMGSRWPLRHTLHKKICKILAENNLELAYPQLEVHLNQSQNKELQGLIRT